MSGTRGDRPGRPARQGPTGPQEAGPLERIEVRRRSRMGVELGLARTGNPHRDLTVSKILEANRRTGRYPRLAGISATDLASETRVLAGPAPNRYHRHPIAAPFEGTGIHQLPFDDEMTEALVLRRFHDVVLVRGGGFVTILRGNEIDDASSGIVMRQMRLSRLADAITTIPHAAVCDGPHKSGNPIHFIADRLTRGVLLHTLAGAPASAIAIGTDEQPFARFAAAAVHPGHIHLAAGTPYRVEQLDVLSTTFRPTGHPFWYLDETVVRTIVPRLLAGVPERDGPKAVYLARKDTSRRPMRNEDKLIAALEAHGVTTLVMSQLAPAEQLAAVRGAGLVIGPHGGALTHILAARPGTRFVELFNPAIGTASFAALSLVSDADYTPLFGTPEEAGDGWTIDIDTVLDAALGRRTV
ncbi:glycosyltransferase family 61 protein [Acuticoccus sediminis]|uniref:glycosyltransferase family 61 protein n=1 Tax=Acuticoccus sediminis TaxID=2184697 RepID=UPI001CFE0844|nr:glycosyltransferase family 61 protein [Acuticoccus sediminis]